MLGGLGTGSIEGVLTTGGVAAAAPTISNVEAKMRDALIAQGMDADTASNATKGITSLALAGAGVAAGLNTSSTVTAVNVDANNRQLHPEEAALIKQLAQDYAQDKGISITEAEKRLTRGALYNIDVGWQSSIENYIDDKEIQTYQQAYKYLTNQTRDISVYDLANQPIPEADQPTIGASDPNLPHVTLDNIVVTANKSNVLDFEKQRAVYYVDTAANGFTATKEDFNNQTLFMNTAYADEQTTDLYDQSANMKFGTDISAKEAAMIYGANNVANIAGLISGANKAIDNNVETIKTEANKSAKDHLDDAITASKNIVETVKGATSNVVNDPSGTWDSAVDKAGQLQEGALTEWNYRKLKRQQALPYDVTYKDAQMVGGLGADAMMGGAAGRGAKITKEGLGQLGKVNIDVTPKPATVVGASDTSGATTITGKSNGTKNGIGAAETGGAILAIGDAKEGAYTNNSGSITGPGGGNATNTGQSDNNGNEIYQRESGGYYYIDDKGVQRPAASPNVRPATNDAKYNWLDEQRNPDPNVQSSFNAQSKPLSNNQYYKTEAEWQAPGKGTGLNYKVYQQEIDLNAKPRESLGDMRTNADRMKQGGSPYVLKNGQYEQIQLHHSRQDGRGALFETSESTHLNLTNQNGRQAVHPYSLQQHPDYPVDRPKFKTDKETYWKDRLNQLQGD